jgi:hypothetical protein
VQRAAITAYNIAEYGATKPEIVIDAMKVKSSKNGCTFVTVAEMWSEAAMDWIELRSNKYVTVDLNPAQPKITWTADMKWYLEEGQWLATLDLNEPPTTMPTSIYLNLRFRSQDLRNGFEISDYINF